METSDEQLIEEFLAGDEAAFETLLTKYLKPIFNFIYQLVKDRSVSDDLTQETFFKAWKNMKKYDPDRTFKTWLFAIAKNTTFDYLKKKKTLPFSLFLDEKGQNELDNLSDNIILPDEILERSDLAKMLTEKLKTLPLNYRLILDLYYKDEFSLREISEILDEPYNTVKSRYSRALYRLKVNFLK